MRGATLGVVAAIALAGSGLAFGGVAQERGDQTEATAPPPEAPLVDVHTHLNRTAVWVGDSIVWTVELTCAPTVDVLADDLSGDKLALVGLELMGSETERTMSGDGTLIYRVHYRLAAYEVAETQLRIAPFKVRYYERRPGQRAEDVATAGEAAVPGALIAWRSTIPSGLQSIDLRPERPAEAPPSVLAWARPVGLTLVVMSIAPVVLWGAAKVHQLRRPRERRPTLRASRNHARSALATLVTAETSTEADRRAAYTRLNDVIRQYLSDATGIAAAALTSDEVTARFSGGDTRRALAGLGDVLAECDDARYGPAERVPTGERFRSSVDTVERLV